MRLSEKTIELTLCARMSAGLQYPVWFGLTQAQEYRAGFDAAFRLRGRLFLFQFKASNTNVGGSRRFTLPHRQLCNLQRLARGNRSVFYVLPMTGDTHTLHSRPDILADTWILDVSTLPTIPPPTKRDGTPRISGRHYLDVNPPYCVLRSDPIEVDIFPASELRTVLAGRGGLLESHNSPVKDLSDLGFTEGGFGLVVS